ncbi:MAG: choice-of-anchor J domain-containing protein, partial [Cytophagales bacterium]|nr:choice-of-anchor J domain-containing protein [Cytophagales bacterium]
PMGFWVSTVSGSGYAPMAMLPTMSGSVTGTIYTRFMANTAPGMAMGAITVASGMTYAWVSVSGNSFDPMATTPGLMIMPIADVKNAINANFVPTITGAVTIAGRIYGVNAFGTAPGTNYTYSLIDPTAGITIRSNTGTYPNTTLPAANMEGYLVTLVGTVAHFNGLMQITPTQIFAIATTSSPLKQPMMTSVLNEQTESDIVWVVADVDQADWNNSPATSFNVDITVSGMPYVMRIANTNPELFGKTFTQVFGSGMGVDRNVTIIGLGGQFDNADPRNAGYQLFPYRANHIITQASMNAPMVNAMPNMLAFGNVTLGGMSSEMMFTVMGNNLTTSSVNIHAPMGFWVSTSSGGSFNPMAMLPIMGGSVAGTIFVKFMANTTAGMAMGVITVASGMPMVGAWVTVTGNSFNPAAPIVTANPMMLSFGNVTLGGMSAEMMITVIGNNLTTSSVNIHAPMGFMVSTTSGSGYAPMAMLPISSGMVSGVIYTRFMANTAPGMAMGAITVSSGMPMVSAWVTVTGNSVTPSVTYTMTQGFIETFASHPTTSGWNIVNPVYTGRTWLWSSTNGNMEGNGFGATGASDNWLITPKVTFLGSNMFVGLTATYAFADAGTHDPIGIYYSTNYTGTGDPTASTWTLVSTTIGVLSAGGFNTFSATANQSGYIAFRYKSSGGVSGSSVRWRIDNVSVSGVIKENIISGDNSILNFTLGGFAGVVGSNTIVVNVPFGTTLANMTAIGTIHPQATVNPAFSTSMDYSTSKTFTVTAQNLSTKIYTVSVNVAPNTSGIVSISTIKNAIDANFRPTIATPVTIAGRYYGNNTFSLTPGSNYQYVLIDATGGVTIRSNTSGNPSTTMPGGNLEGYNVTLAGTIATFNGLMQVTPIAILGIEANTSPLKAPAMVAALDENAESDFITVVADVDSSDWLNSPSASFNVDITVSGVAYIMRIVNTNPALYGKTYSEVFGIGSGNHKNVTITGLGGQFDSTDPLNSGYQTFPYLLSHIKTTQNSKSNANDMTSFMFAMANNPSLTQDVMGTITGTNVYFDVYRGMDLSALIPTIAVSNLATVSPAITVTNFNIPKNFSVVAESGLSKTYTVRANPYLFISPAGIITIPALGGIYEVTVTSNVSWSVEGLSTQVSGANTSIVVLTVPPNFDTIAGVNYTLTVSSSNLIGYIYLLQSEAGVTDLNNTYISDHVTIAPNPATNYLGIKCACEGYITITNATGGTVLSQDINLETKLEVSALAAGLYQINIFNTKSGKVFTTKLIKE